MRKNNDNFKGKQRDNEHKAIKPPPTFSFGYITQVQENHLGELNLQVKVTVNSML
jgi:hypothetical protein